METSQENKKIVDTITNQIEELNQKVQISYPTMWKYKVIGYDENKVKNCIMSVLEQKSCKEHKISYSKKSKNGKYQSFALEVLVECEKDRIDIYESIRVHKDIKMVL